MMSTVDIPSPEDTMSLGTECVHIFREFTIEDDLSLPGIFRFPTIREVDTEDVEDLLIALLSEFYMRDPSLICCGI